ncbi:unnamed protein product [Diamesa tonsa]
MAECSYVRCLQERRSIKRELQKWYKSMVYIVGLERVAEELMGRKKWKNYQDSLTQSNATDLLIKPSIENNCEHNHNNKLNHKETNSIENETKTEDDHEDIEIKTEPEDWKPQDKCYFCVDGKLLKVNEIGELVVESGPVLPDTELNKQIIESDDSSSSSDTPQKPLNNIQLHNHRQQQQQQHHQQQQQQLQQQQQYQQLLPKNLEALLKQVGVNPNMTSLESMAAQFAALQRLQTVPELNPFYHASKFISIFMMIYDNLMFEIDVCIDLFYQQFQQHSPTGADRTASPSNRITPNSSNDLSTPSTNNSTPTVGTSTGEQPLDLSAKPSGPCSSVIDSKHIFKAKPRISTVPGRRSYTEEELNNALQDILSGKLGTRRAAVLYGIPRSTLRNKVYKLALEQKREVLANNPPVAVLETDGDDKDSDVDDEKDVDMKLNAMQSTEQLQAYMRAQMYENQANQQKNELKESKSPCETSQNMAGSSWPIDPNTWLQSLLLAGSSGGFGGMGALGGAFPALMQASPEELATLPEFLRKLLTQPQELKNSNNDHMDGGSSNGPSSAVNTMDHRLMMSLLSQQQHQQQKSLLQKQPRPSGTPETCSSLDLNDGTDDSQVILKVPSVKSLYGSSSGHNKNGDTTTSNSTPSTSPQISSVASVLSNTSPQPNHLSLRSPAAMLQRHRSESESPPFSINEVIRNSIRENFKIDKHSTPLMIDPMDHYGKRPSISVIKNLGGTDISRFGSNPNITQSMNQHNQMGPLSPNTGTGGKGTRPKRGKYRNYDRDSLVEAVKAVQRGEMSVHRAGSYYGVPHSTLEYKVKERHLMRPRKREPKPQPTDDRTGAGPSAKSQEIGGGGGSGAGLRTMDKNKTLSNNKAPLKPPFPSPNGMKMPIFDPAMAAQLQYTSQLFWQHPGSFPGMSGLDFARAAAAASQNPAANTPGFPPNADFFTQQMLQKFQEDHSFKSPVNGNSGGGGGGSGNGANSGGGGGGQSNVGGIGLGVGGVGGIGEEGGGGGGGGGGADSFNSVTCFCGKPFAGRPMIECSGCLTWLHMSCAKVKRKNIPEFYFCEKCKATGTATNSSGEEGSGSIVGGSSLGGGVGGSGGGSGGGVGAENNSTSSNNTNINLNNNLSTKMINTNPMDLSQLQIVNVKPRKQSKLMSKKSATTNNNNNNNNRMMNSSDNIKNINASDNKFVNKKSSPMNGKLKKIQSLEKTYPFVP